MVDIELHDNACKFRVQMWDRNESSTAALESIIDTKWPAAVGSVAEGRCRVLCIGPTDWIVIGTSMEPPALSEAMSHVATAAFSAVDVSAGLSRVTLRGSGVRDLLSQGCGLDLDPRMFAPGSCTRTRLMQIPAVLHCSDSNSFDCYVSRSYLSCLLASVRVVVDRSAAEN